MLSGVALVHLVWHHSFTSLNLVILLAPPQTSKSFLQPLSDSSSCGVAPSHIAFKPGVFHSIPNQRARTTVHSIASTCTSLAGRRLHLIRILISLRDISSMVILVIFQGLLNSERRFTFPLVVFWKIFLYVCQ